MTDIISRRSARRAQFSPTITRATSKQSVSIENCLQSHIYISAPAYKMHVAFFITVLTSLFASSLAKDVYVKNRHFGGNDKVHIGNTNCGQDVYHFQHISCDGNAQVHIGDIVPEGCHAPGHFYEDIKIGGHCRMLAGNLYLTKKNSHPRRV